MKPSIMPSEPFSLSQQVEGNLYEYFTHLGKTSNVYSHPPQGEILFSGVDHPLFNWAYNLSLSSVEDISLLKKQFLRKPATWVLCDSESPEIRQILEEGGIKHIGTNDCLYFDLTQPTISQQGPKGLEIVKVQTHEQYLFWCELSAISFEHEPRMCDGMMKGFPKGVDPAGLYHMYIALLDGRPVGQCSLYLGKTMAGNYWGSVHPSYRRQGIGTQMTLHRMEVARQKGYKSLAIQVSSETKPLWEKLGFQKTSNLYLYASNP